MFRFLFIFIFCFTYLISFGQEKRTISGYITDGETGEKLFGAAVFDTVSKLGVTTNDYGFFSLTIPKETAFLRVGFYGLRTRKSTTTKKRIMTMLEIGSKMTLNLNSIGEIQLERYVGIIKFHPNFL